MPRRRTTRRRRSTGSYSSGSGLKWFFLLLLIVGIYFFARVSLVWNAKNSNDAGLVAVTIERGSTVSRIADLLEQKNLIKDAWVFGLFVKKNGLTAKLQAGEYVVPKNLTMAEITDALSLGKSEEVKITIPEGYTIAQIDELLANKGLINRQELLVCVKTCDFDFTVANWEGYLYPETYFVPTNNFRVKDFMARTYNTLQKKAKTITNWENNARTEYELINMASLIEREAANDAEMPIIAGILWKRIDEGIHLGVDATTRYELNDWKNPLYRKDLEAKTPFNTRLNLGLPPHAIGNPGAEALSAAANPESSPYYYYLHDPSGKIRYGRTLAEHNANKAKYLR